MDSPVIRVVAYPKDANPDGDVFGGWMLSMMDSAAAFTARKTAKTRVVTVALENMKFLLPVHIGDCLECYCTVEKIGNTSMVVKVDAIVVRRDTGTKEQVTEGRFVFVAIDEDRRPVKVIR